MNVRPQVEVPVCPRRSHQVQARKVGRDTLIVHLVLKQYHVLNHIAGRIWDLADGAHTADEIAAMIAAEFGADPVTVADDVMSTVEALVKLRLIEYEAAP